MFSTLKGRISASLLASKSNHTVSRANLYLALFVASLVALLSALLAFAQWQVGETLATMQQERARTVEKKVSTYAHMASQQANAHRATLNVLLSRDAKEFQEAEALRRSNLQGYLDSSRLLGDRAELYDAVKDLQVITARYEEISAQVVELFREGRKEDALNLRVSHLREAFNRWQQAHADFSTKLAQSAEEQKRDYEEATASSRRWLASLLIAPIILIILGILGIAAMFGLERLKRDMEDNWTH